MIEDFEKHERCCLISTENDITSFKDNVSKLNTRGPRPCSLYQWSKNCNCFEINCVEREPVCYISNNSLSRCVCHQQTSQITLIMSVAPNIISLVQDPTIPSVPAKLWPVLVPVPGTTQPETERERESTNGPPVLPTLSPTHISPAPKVYGLRTYVLPRQQKLYGITNPYFTIDPTFH